MALNRFEITSGLPRAQDAARFAIKQTKDSRVPVVAQIESVHVGFYSDMYGWVHWGRDPRKMMQARVAASRKIEKA